MLPLTLEIISWNKSWIATQFMVPNLCIWPTFIKTVFYKSTKATANLRAIGLLLLSHWVTSSSFVTPWTVAHQVFLSMRFPHARILAWVAISFSRESSWPRDGTGISCIARQILYHWSTREAASRPFKSYLKLLGSNPACPKIMKTMLF